MNIQDKLKLCKLVEQVQQDEVVELEEKFYVLSADLAGEIGVAGRYNAKHFKWEQPMQVFGIEEAPGSKHKYSKKTQEMLELFAPGSPHYEKLKTMAIMIARDTYKHGEGYAASDWYYNTKSMKFEDTDNSWSGSKYFKAVMLLYNGI